MSFVFCEHHGNHGFDTNEAMVRHMSKGSAGSSRRPLQSARPKKLQTNNSHRCLWLGHQGGSSSSMQRRQRSPLKPSGILMLYSHRQHHLHCAQRHLVHMIVKGLACRMRKKPSPSSKNAPEAARRLRARAAAASWLVPMQGWTKAACQMSSASAAGPYQTTGCEGRRWPAARSHCGIEAPC